MGLSYRHLIRSLSRLPFVDAGELARLLGEPPSTVHSALKDIFDARIARRVDYGTAHLDSSQRYYLTSTGIAEASRILGFRTLSEYVRAYPMSREWIRLLIGRMDVVAGIYRLAATMSPGADGYRTRVEFHRKGLFDATIVLHNEHNFGIVRQGRALRRTSFRDRLRAIGEDKSERSPDTILILTPSPWERNLTARWATNIAFQNGYVAAESRSALTRRNLRVWRQISSLGEGFHTLDFVRSQGSPFGGITQNRRSANERRYPIPNGWYSRRPSA